MKSKFTKEEKEILESLEKGEWNSTHDHSIRKTKEENDPKSSKKEKDLNQKKKGQTTADG